MSPCALFVCIIQCVCECVCEAVFANWQNPVLRALNWHLHGGEPRPTARPAPQRDTCAEEVFDKAYKGKKL